MKRLKIIRTAEGESDNGGSTPADRVEEPANHGPDHDAPPTPVTHTAPEHTTDDDTHRAIASLTQTVAELQTAVSQLVADGQPVPKNDPTPKKMPWTHRGRKS